MAKAPNKPEEANQTNKHVNKIRQRVIAASLLTGALGGGAVIWNQGQKPEASPINNVPSSKTKVLDDVAPPPPPSGLVVDAYRIADPYAIFPELGDTASPTTQASVDKLYADLYNQVAEAQKQAREHKKPLLILVGESHVDQDSLLVEAALLDICQRLKINTASFERPEGIIGNYINNTQRRRAEIEATQVRDNTYNALSDWGRNALHQTIFFSQIDAVAKEKQEAEGNDTYRAILTTGHGMQLRGDDVILPQDMLASKLLDPEFDRERTAHIVNQHRTFTKEDTIAVNGANHLPPLVKELKETHHILCFNAQNMDLPKDNPLSSARQKELADHPEIYKPIIVSGQHIAPTQAFAKVNIAAAKHRRSKKEMTEAEYQAFDKIYASFKGNEVSSPGR